MYFLTSSRGVSEAKFIETGSSSASKIARVLGSLSGFGVVSSGQPAIQSVASVEVVVEAAWAALVMADFAWALPEASPEPCPPN